LSYFHELFDYTQKITYTELIVYKNVCKKSLLYLYNFYVGRNILKSDVIYSFVIKYHMHETVTLVSFLKNYTI